MTIYVPKTDCDFSMWGVGDLEILILVSPFFPVLFYKLQVCSTSPVVYSTSDQTQGFTHDRQALNQST